jgi:hypothetical protein
MEHIGTASPRIRRRKLPRAHMNWSLGLERMKFLDILLMYVDHIRSFVSLAHVRTTTVILFVFLCKDEM